MRPFTLDSAVDLAHASRLGRGTGQGQTDAAVQFLAGGTTLIDLMKLDVLRPQRVVNLQPLHAPAREIEFGPDGVRLSAFAKMALVADHPRIRSEYPALAQSLALAASPQIRNMATLGGNLLQKTRCPYYRDPSWSACNKRDPGSGCAAIAGFNRNHAVLGVDQSCIALYPGDFGVALVALDAQLQLSGPRGARRIPCASLHRPAQGQPHIEVALDPGEIITEIHVPNEPWTRRSLYLKVRDRESYEFAIASAAVALETQADHVVSARIGLGGVAYRPGRAQEAEALLAGKPLTEANAQVAADAALNGAQCHGQNDYKPELARRTIVRALLQARALPVSSTEPGHAV
jgi:xanthine dehydrogenase YagS FAD-binding subunit